jgi:hypothetical protein
VKASTFSDVDKSHIIHLRVKHTSLADTNRIQ